MKIKIILGFIMVGAISLQAQFHTLKIPQYSNQVEETQRLGVTDITIKYGSPSANNREVWQDPNVIPQNGEPIAWRAGANMNTTIEFSTDVIIEGKPLNAGKYGFHVIPKGERYTLIFAHNNEQWGSYYLDLEKDVTLQVDVNLENADFSEKLDYEFVNWTENSVTIGLEWANKRLPFKVDVNLNNTVVESFRRELRGINTYHWQAWNDAALWCLNHDTNLEEALLWSNRSINGGFGGFAADKNASNMGTKAALLKRLGQEVELDKTIGEMVLMPMSLGETGDLFRQLLSLERPGVAVEVCSNALKEHPKDFVLLINRGVSHYYNGDAKKGVKDIEKSITLAPKNLNARLTTVIKEMKAGTYKYPNI